METVKVVSGVENRHLLLALPAVGDILGLGWGLGLRLPQRSGTGH